MNPADLTARLQLGLAAAREAGALTLEYFQRDGLAVEWKADASPVTIADRRAEQLLRERIAAAFPDDGILGEELGERAGSSGYRWILDPIDGTKSFIHGVPLYGTLVGVEWETRAALGIILIPALGECLHAARGQGAWHARGDSASRRVQVSTVATLGESLFLTSEVASFGKRGAAAAGGWGKAQRAPVVAPLGHAAAALPQALDDGKRGAAAVYDRLQAASRLARTWGDCYGYLLVATGRAELMVDPLMNVWDAAAVQPIIEEAGGTFTDWQGRPTIHSGEGIATNGRILGEVLKITAG